jgi:hypothetical protein
VFLTTAVWVATVAMAVALLWIGFSPDFVDQMATASGVIPSPGDVLVFHAVFLAFSAVMVGYASVGALLAGRDGAGRIGALLLAGGFLFGLVPFGYVIGLTLTLSDPSSPVANLILLLGPVATGPGFAMILPGLAIAFPDGHLPSHRWRWPVGIVAGVIAIGTLLNIIRPGPVAGGPAGQSLNPLGVDALPAALGQYAYYAVSIGILAMTALGVAAVVARYRRGSPVERQQQRWFLAAVLLIALPVAMSLLPGTGGATAGFLAGLGLLLIPIAVGIAVTRYRLYEIDHLISRTLVYVPLTALLAGLYAATVTLLQRVFQSVTGDTSDAAIIISTLILASVFTPVRKWLEGIVERRFKAHPANLAGDSVGAAQLDAGEWEARVTAIVERVVRKELDARATGKRPEPARTVQAPAPVRRMAGEEGFEPSIP